MELDAITKLTPSERDRLRKSGGCFRCRQAGHLARDCPLPNCQHPRLDAMEQEEHTEELGKNNLQGQTGSPEDLQPKPCITTPPQGTPGQGRG